METNAFDELYNQFFGDKNKKNNDGIAKMLNLMGKLNSGVFDDAEALGPPDSVREFEKDGIIFEESSWTTELGTIVKISTKENVEFEKDFFKQNNIPLGRGVHKTVNKKELSLDDQLKMAIKDENYEKACFLRDQINNVNNIGSDNKVDDNNEWNF